MYNAKIIQKLGNLVWNTIKINAVDKLSIDLPIWSLLK